MAFYRSSCDDGCRAQIGNDNCCGFGSLGGLPSGRPFGLCRDQCQDGPSGFKNLRNFINPSGTMQGTVYTNLSGDIVGRFSGKIDGVSELMGCFGNFGNLGDFGLRFPFSFQFGNRAM